jgi:uncharacterized protein YdaU (DUF1376 family)
MSERPFMQLYVSDFVGDTLLLSTEQIGAYLLLLIALWNADGVLPNEEAKLARVARLSVKRWRKIAVDLLPFFVLGEETLTHHRLAKELRKTAAKSQSRAMSGSKGGRANALKYHGAGPANARPLLKHLPESIYKQGVNGPHHQENQVRLDRYADEALFKACEALSGAAVPSYQQFKSFPVEMVEEARGAAVDRGDAALVERPPPSPAGVPPLKGEGTDAALFRPGK